MATNPATGCPPEQRRFVLIVAILGSSVGFIDGTVVNVAISAIREDLGASLVAVQWVANAYTLALSAFILIGGAAGDRFGTRRVFHGGVVLFALASLACAVSFSPATLVAARIVQGFGAAFMVPASLALIARNYPEEERGQAIGTWAAVTGIAAAVGPILGGALIDFASWHWVFLINLPLAVATILLSRAKVPDDRPSGASGALDIAGALLAAAGFGALTLGLTLLTDQTLDRTGAPWWIAGGCAGIALFVLWELRASAPMMPPAMFRSRAFSGANLLTLLLYAALGGVFFYLPLVLIVANGFSAAFTGTIFLPFTIVMALLSRRAGRWSDVTGPRLLLIAGPAITAVAFVVIGLGPAWDPPWLALGLGMALFGLGMGLAIPPLSSVVMATAGEERSGIASGINNAVARFAGLLAVAAFGIIAVGVYEASLGEAGAMLNGLGFGAPLPDGAPEGTAAAQRTAMFAGFEAVAWTGAGLSVLSALVAAFTIGSKAPEGSAPGGGAEKHAR